MMKDRRKCELICRGDFIKSSNDKECIHYICIAYDYKREYNTHDSQNFNVLFLTIVSNFCHYYLNNN